ncbi:MAG: RNA polymerase sigma-54 factor [Bacteroidetes bacterium GWE2_41_25]|nr:MAG: RNA polymerase sigma-54 factor [Bacteroidetes bacterium GWA2_40_15]OFX91297.1 MAG: RNA polymerase sigma-54 factor [Bacteroidetes bacterium GWE2_41_25]OFX95542.1 MAG: RNA polymerase sigma-54 factor [Bacteroidetes bacterium GWC2_40_22]OFY61778.1 MAG: RNA polymerase sigma-54 factor [Bacteroidetes bacterium GWF2_41_9]HAM08904.1 RNA polymerase sigma-54 factor [Bacteroidales bacterium]
MLRQKLQQKMLQKLSPQQIQMIKLLEVPTLQIEERIKKELEENPALEEGTEEEEVSQETQEEDQFEEDDKDQDEFTLDDYIEDDDIPDYRLQAKNTTKDEERRAEIPFSVGFSFHEHLESQIGLRDLTDKQEILGQYIIGNIDEDGYLRRELINIVDDLAFLQNIETTEEELEVVLKIIQDLEPAGVGARTLKECLLLQIDKRDKSLPAVRLAYTILDSYFEEFSKRHYDKIIARLDIEESDLKAAIDEVLKLNPKPGGVYNDPFSKSSQPIIPDFILELSEDGFDLHLNSRNLPELRLSSAYNEMLRSYSKDKNQKKEMKDAVQFVKQKIDSAKWFIDAIRQRQNTLLLTMNAILEYQKEYFIDGDETRLRPMILKDVAEMTGFDISTVSRVANSKFIQTHFGILPLKYFFSEGLQTDTGEEVSTREIKRILQDCIDNEQKRKPLTDERLTEILQEKGYQIARRTVAKYREQLNIPVARLRKEI